jgi:hypothetical protein
MWRLLVIFWERAERLVPEPVLMDLLYAGNASISQTDSFRVQICRHGSRSQSRKALSPPVT